MTDGTGGAPRERFRDNPVRLTRNLNKRASDLAPSGASANFKRRTGLIKSAWPRQKQCVRGGETNIHIRVERAVLLLLMVELEGVNI